MADAKSAEWNRLERIVSLALKSAIDAHGPITKDRLLSASKRVVGQLLADAGPSTSEQA